MDSVEITVEQLASLVLGDLADHLNLGCYEGTNIPLRQIPAHALLTIHADGTVEDGDGGWIADRFCVGSKAGTPCLGQRHTRAVFLTVKA